MPAAPIAPTVSNISAVPVDLSIQALAELLEDPLDRALRPPHRLGDLGHLVPLDPQLDDRPVSRWEGVEDLVDDQAEDGQRLLVAPGLRVEGPVERLAAGGLAHVAAGGAVVGADGP